MNDAMIINHKHNSVSTFPFFRAPWPFWAVGKESGLHHGDAVTKRNGTAAVCQAETGQRPSVSMARVPVPQWPFSSLGEERGKSRPAPS